ncbi:hypothetical protein [Dickeya chrysanthemi]|uniref:hypothetical protein n=1 Tax=Dickeya chrysanthemi TaxID=556 RepID=UPI0003A587C0|nr:hypothetical protein [Dickeya chrysanthemi]MBX9445768.1 hypothetical protein [Dickeya chrysanthemi]
MSGGETCPIAPAKTGPLGLRLGKDISRFAGLLAGLLASSPGYAAVAGCGQNCIDYLREKDINLHG